MATEEQGTPVAEPATTCRVCGNQAQTSPCVTCESALELLRGFSGIEHWEHVAAIASRIVQLPAKERIIMEILLLEMEN